MEAAAQTTEQGATPLGIPFAIPFARLLHRFLFAVGAPLALGCAGCHSLVPETGLEPGPVARIVASGTVDCFPAGLQSSPGVEVFCEASAAVALPDRIVIASDKPVPGRSPVMQVLRQGTRLDDSSVAPMLAEPFVQASKLEAMALTPDGRYLIAATAFDRVDDDSEALDTFNTLLVWPSQAPEAVQVVQPTVRHGVRSSLGIRAQLAQHIGLPYFKVEGLAALPGNRLVFGIRETGQDHRHAAYRILLIETRYEIVVEPGAVQLKLAPNWRTLLDFTPDASLGLPADLGVSSLEYAPATGKLYMLTSLERGATVAAYLWQMDVAPDGTVRQPQLVRTDGGAPLRFQHKAEGLAVLDASHLLMLHDDDRRLDRASPRKPNQAPYDIVRMVR